MTWEIRQGDVLDRLKEMPDCSVQCVVTSPPYWGLRDYGVEGQIGLEKTPDAYVAKMVEVFREVKRVLREDGTLWLNLGDTYAADRGYQVPQDLRGSKAAADAGAAGGRGMKAVAIGLKPKDLVGIPWRVAFALQADGWYLRSDIIWSKPNPMPESVTDRPTKAHEYLFLLAKSGRYYFDAKAIAEPIVESTIKRLAQPNLAQQEGSDRVPGKTNGRMKAVPPRFGGTEYGDSELPEHRTKSGNDYEMKDGLRNKRTVWTVATQPFKEAHFATFPEALVQPCIKAGSRIGDTVLDPFAGSGTTGVVALSLSRSFVGIELNKDYAEMARRRIGGVMPLFECAVEKPDYEWEGADE